MASGKTWAHLTLLKNYLKTLRLRSPTLSTWCFRWFFKSLWHSKHDILSLILNHYGIHGIIHDWFKDYLTNRTQSITFVFFNTQTNILWSPTGQCLRIIFIFFFILMIFPLMCSPYNNTSCRWRNTVPFWKWYYIIYRNGHFWLWNLSQMVCCQLANC